MTKTRTGNFTPAEDEQLCRSWLEISMDPLTNNSQRKEQFWDRITEKFNKYAGTGREAKSLSNRYVNFFPFSYTYFLFLYSLELTEAIAIQMGCYPQGNFEIRGNIQPD